MAETITLKLTNTQETKLYEAFKEHESRAPAYAKWQLKPEGAVITCYESGKTVFQGKDASIYASSFQTAESDEFPQAGSDEVGTGDYFGPVCVAASYIDKDHAALMKKLGVRDSKALNDEQIRRIAPELMKNIPYSLLILDNGKYNTVHETNNMNAIKAKLHNQAYVNLSKKIALPKKIIIDQFTPENLYYRYISGEKNIIRNIHFETKAEDKYPAVGASSIIARYAFLISMDRMSEEWGMEFQKGAGAPADKCAKEFVKKHGFDNLSKVAKIHFKNTENL